MPPKKPPQKRTNKWDPEDPNGERRPKDWVDPRPADTNHSPYDGPKCNVRRSAPPSQPDKSPGLCGKPAGWGTDHKGEGPCKLHGGNSPQVLKKLAQKNALENSRNHAVQVLGMPVNIGPHEALLMEVQRTAGHIQWLAERIASIGEESEIEALQQWTIMGIKPSFWLETYQEERKHLVQVSKAAIQCGVAERQVQLAEEQGKLLAMAIRAILWDAQLDLTPQQQARAPQIIRRHLLSLPTSTSTGQAGQPIDAELVTQGD